MLQMDNFEPLKVELTPATQVVSGDNEKKQPSFTHIMSTIIAQSQTQTGPNAHTFSKPNSFSKMIKELLNHFWIIKWVLKNTSHHPQQPQTLKDCFLQLEIFSQTNETDSFQKILKNFFFVQKIFQSLDSIVNYFY